MSVVGNLWRHLIAVISIAVIATPAAADELFAVTPSGNTESYFDLGIVETSDLLANKCVDFGWSIVSSTETTVICEVPVSFGNRLLSALASPAYATPPRQYFRFNLAGAQGFTRAQATSWQEIQTAFGQTQRTDLANENYHNGVMGFFKSVGGIFPPGTIFPNHAAIESDYEFVAEPREGMLLHGFRADSPLRRAGLQEGDVITRIARERIKDNNDLSDGLHKAIAGDQFEVEFYRDGKKMDLMVAVAFNPPTGPLPEPTALAATSPPPSPMIIQNELSVAEELARFAQLRDSGVLTEEEFQEQKRRLLAQ